MQQAVMYGAGNVGRGFLAQLFSESGYQVTFVDIDEPLIAALNARGSYTIRLVDNQHSQEVRVGPVRGLLSSQTAEVAEALAAASIAATAVGARALPIIAASIAGGIRLRAARQASEPLNIIVCENLHGAAELMRGWVHERLDEREREYLVGHVGFVDTVIGRMVPELSPELRAQDPSLIIVEPYKELPVDRSGFVGPIPRIVGLEACDHFALYTARKLYLHNAGHAILAYLGYRRGHKLGYEALDDALIRPILHAALEESVQGIVAKYDASPQWLRAHVAELTVRFANRVLADPILRLARDPLRKLAPQDRLVGAARVAQAAGVTPVNMAWAIAAGLSFDAPEDPLAQQMQARIHAEGLAAVMASVCEIRADEPLGAAVLARYRRLQEEPQWQKARG